MTYTGQLLRRFNTRGPERGPCNICGDVGLLTEDHIPPKGVTGSGAFNLVHLHEALEVSKGSSQVGVGRQFQNGVWYRSICATCNSKRLGTEYDPALIDLANYIAEVLRSESPPKSIYPRLKVSRIVRSIVGHVLAIGIGKSPTGVMGEAMRDYFLNPHAPVPNLLNAYVWVYPSRRRVIIRHAGRSSFGGNHDPYTFSLLKFFPCALMLTWNTEGAFGAQLGSLTESKMVGIDDVLETRIPLRRLPWLGWPEYVGSDDSAFLLHMDDSGVAYPKD